MLLEQWGAYSIYTYTRIIRHYGRLIGSGSPYKCSQLTVKRAGITLKSYIYKSSRPPQHYDRCESLEEALSRARVEITLDARRRGESVPVRTAQYQTV